MQQAEKVNQNHFSLSVLIAVSNFEDVFIGRNFFQIFHIVMSPH